jgi:3-phenylpropionate/trans-cinnamate dioxygenase ferredoxin reductase component
MAERHVDILLIGGGLASANCARWLREEGFDGSVLLVGREPDPPYNRPPCSKGYMQGKEAREETFFRPNEWWNENDLELALRTSVMKLDAGGRVATLSNKDEVRFEQALIATGANVRRLPVEGSDEEGIHYLRTLRNADTIRADVEESDRVVLIGGSYIATEVAASLTLLGKSCTLLCQEEVVLSRTFGETAGRYFQGVLEEHGVTVHGGENLARFEGTGERVTKAVAESGLELECDAIVMGVGAVPDVTLARGAGLELGERGGVRCDSRLRTSAEGIFAAGDICEYDSVVHRREIRIEHWDVAFNQGKTAALNLLGRDVAHDAVPYFFSDLADWTGLEYLGPAERWDTEIVRGSVEDGAFSVWYLDGGTVAACLSVGRGDDLETAGRLISSHADVSDRTGELADPDSDLVEIS